MADGALRVYVDARPLDVPPAASVIDALEIADPTLARAVRSGEKDVTDSRGLPIAADSPLYSGAILRVIPVRKQQ